MRKFVLRDHARSSDEEFVPFPAGTTATDALKLASAVEQHGGIAALRKVLALRSPPDRVGHARAALHGEGGAVSGLVETILQGGDLAAGP